MHPILFDFRGVGESAAELVILGVLRLTERQGRAFPGRTFWSYMLLYVASRFAVEFCRGDSRGMVGMRSTSQFVSLLIVPVGIAMLVYPSRHPQPAPPVAAWHRAG